jgi:hypothetical protein
MRGFIKFVAVLLAFMALTLQRTEAQVLYGADGAGGNPATNLYILNPATGAVVSTVGPIGFAVTGMAFHPTTGVLYGTTGARSLVAPNSLITINTTTGAGTLIGANGTGTIADIAFRADGTLFGWTEPINDDLVTINIATGAATIVADSGLATFGDGMSFSPAGVLFFAGDGNDGFLRTVNATTGLTTNVATLSGSPGAARNAISAGAFNAARIFFAVDLANVGGGGGGGGGGVAFLVTIDTTTGVVTNVGATVDGLDAIAFAPLAVVAPVPALSERGMAILGLIIMGSALVLQRRV